MQFPGIETTPEDEPQTAQACQADQHGNNPWYAQGVYSRGLGSMARRHGLEHSRIPQSPTCLASIWLATNPTNAGGPEIFFIVWN